MGAWDEMVGSGVDGPLVGGVRDEEVVVRPPCALNGRTQLIGTRARHAELAVLPVDVPRAADENHAIVGAAARAARLGSGRGTGPCHQSLVADSLGVVDSNDRCRRALVRPRP